MLIAAPVLLLVRGGTVPTDAIAPVEWLIHASIVEVAGGGD